MKADEKISQLGYGKGQLKNKVIFQPSIYQGFISIREKAAG